MKSSTYTVLPQSFISRLKNARVLPNNISKQKKEASVCLLTPPDILSFLVFSLNAQCGTPRRITHNRNQYAGLGVSRLVSAADPVKLIDNSDYSAISNLTLVELVILCIDHPSRLSCWSLFATDTRGAGIILFSTFTFETIVVFWFRSACLVEP